MVGSQVACSQDIRARPQPLPLIPAQKRPYARKQFAHAERLGDI